MSKLKEALKSLRHNKQVFYVSMIAGMNPEERQLRQDFYGKKEEAQKLVNEGKHKEARILLDEAKEAKSQLVNKGYWGRSSEENNNIGIQSMAVNQVPEPLEKGEVRTFKASEKLSKIAEHYRVDGEQQALSVGKYVRGLVTGEWQGAKAEQQAMAQGVLSDGGYLVPQRLSTELIDLARNKARTMQAGALTVPMESNNLTIARIKEDPQVNWKKENEPIEESGMSFDGIELKTKTLVGMARMSVELFEDASNIDGVVSDAIAQALGVELDRVGLFGTGTDPQPLGIANTDGIQEINLGDNGAPIESYGVFSQAVEKIQNVNGEANAIIYAPRTAGAIDRLTDTTGQPLNAPTSFKELEKFTTNQVPTNLTHGEADNSSVAFVGDWSKLLYGMRTNLTLEVSREAANAFENLQVVIRAYLRADVGVLKPDHFVLVNGIIPEE